jgi:predicted MFS family arabinose efflux permease
MCVVHIQQRLGVSERRACRALGQVTLIADLTKGTGRFNLAQGLVGTISGIGASLSTSLSGLVIEKLGRTVDFFSMAVVALAAVAILWLFVPETKPSSP